MKVRNSAISNVIAVVLVIAVLASVGFGIYGFARTPPTTILYSTRSTTYTSTIYGTPRTTYVTNTTTIYKNVLLTETCTAVSYFLPDTVALYVTTVTVTSGNSTYYSQSTSTKNPTTTTIGTTSYTTSTYGNVTTTYTTNSTSQDLNAIPSYGWTVTSCTVSP